MEAAGCIAEAYWENPFSKGFPSIGFVRYCLSHHTLSQRWNLCCSASAPEVISV